ncbi:MAG TPA: GerMN domain-containing protein, partial [Treponemataceae bacterium]|nr:GerMN domain-containing protein [Treponemataceae bacterium]
DFFKYMFGNNPSFVEKYEPTKTANDDSVLLQNESDLQTEFTLSKDKKLVESTKPDVNETTLSSEVSIDNNDTVQKTIEDTSVVKEKPTEEEEKKTIEAVHKTKEYLCFIVIEGNGSLTRKDIIRHVSKSEMPLTNAINNLLSGPIYEEAAKGYLSLIPADTRLISASVKDGVASLNFSSEFLFNKYGVDGYRGQLMQVIYTATAFNTISSVQILIDGVKTEFLGSEGVWIGSPLSRRDF